jgi:hypothetical protein
MVLLRDLTEYTIYRPQRRRTTHLTLQPFNVAAVGATAVRGVGTLDVSRVAVVYAVVFTVAVAAAWVPARRAALTYALVAFRAD